MKCPYCGYDKSIVVDSRQKDNNTISRRRACNKCGYRYSTVEYIYKNPDGSFNMKKQKEIPLATGSDKNHEFVLLIRRKKGAKNEQSNPDGKTHKGS